MRQQLFLSVKEKVRACTHPVFRSTSVATELVTTIALYKFIHYKGRIQNANTLISAVKEQ